MTGARADSTRPDTGLASWYVPGRADGFGDRLLMFDNSGAPSFEVLRFRRELAADPEFEHLLRERVRRLAAFRHPAFAPVRGVQHLSDGDGLALVSEYPEGRRLSELLTQQPRVPVHPRAVTSLLRELTRALDALHGEGPDVAHGALTADRLVLTPDGRLRVVEHVLGSALRHLGLAPSRLWAEFGVVSRGDPAHASPLDARTDLAQAAGVALSMLLGRAVAQRDLEQRLPALLDEVSDRTARASFSHAPQLRLWFERALRLDGAGYMSAADAEVDLRELSAHGSRTVVTAPSGSARHVDRPAAATTGPDAAPRVQHATPASNRGRAAAPARTTGHLRVFPSVTDLAGLTNFPSERPPEARPEPIEAAPSASAPGRPAPSTLRPDGDRAPVQFEFITTPAPASPTASQGPFAAPRQPATVAQAAWSRVRDDRATRVVSLRVAVALGAIATAEAAVIAYLIGRVFLP